MKRPDVFDNLLELAEKVFDRVELSSGDFRGGVCRIRNEDCLVLNKGGGLDRNLRILANALAERNLEEMFVLPALREAIEQYSEE